MGNLILYVEETVKTGLTGTVLLSYFWYGMKGALDIWDVMPITLLSYYL